MPLTVLGTGFLSHPHNHELRERLDVHAFQTALLRLVYRMIFLFVAEDRGALLDPEADEQTRDRFSRYFSTARLRRHALRRLGTAHDDRYRALELLIEALGSEEGRPELGLKGLRWPLQRHPGRPAPCTAYGCRTGTSSRPSSTWLACATPAPPAGAPSTTCTWAPRN